MTRDTGGWLLGPTDAVMHPEEYARYVELCAALDAADRKRKESAQARRAKRALQAARKVQRQARRRGRR